MRLARYLANAGAEVVAVDAHESLVEQIRDEVDRAVCMDATKEDALRAQGIQDVDVAIVGIGTAFENALLTTVLLKQIGVRRVITRATTGMRAEILSKVGADEIINPEHEAAERWRNRLMAPSILERTELAEGYSLVQVAAPKAFHGKTLGELNVRKQYQVQVVAIRRETEELDVEGKPRGREVLISMPMAETKIQQGDVLLLIAGDEALHKFPAQ